MSPAARPTTASNAPLFILTLRAPFPVLEVEFPPAAVVAAVGDPVVEGNGVVRKPEVVGSAVPGMLLLLPTDVLAEGSPDADPDGAEAGAPGVEDLAVAWKASKDFSAVGLMANTIPAWQWLAGVVWAQKNQSGAVALSMVMLHAGKLVAPAATGLKPELTPLFKKVQGAANEDSVTEWFLERNSKLTVSPDWTLMLDGEKASWLPSPTRTWKSAAEAKLAEARRPRATVTKCIFV